MLISYKLFSQPFNIKLNTDIFFLVDINLLYSVTISNTDVKLSSIGPWYIYLEGSTWIALEIYRLRLLKCQPYIVV